MISAKREPPAVQKTIDGLRKSWPEDPITVFQEPDSGVVAGNCNTVVRPDVWCSDRMPCSEDGAFGNFGNWIQSARDILSVSEKTADAIMICEDDILIAHGIRDLVEKSLWPSEDCGVASLYCPAMSQYRRAKAGLNKTAIAFREPMMSIGNLVGALALIFPVKVLRQIVYHESIESWLGSHAQSKNADTKPWDRKAVDTWIGRTILQLGYTAWHFYPSLVEHAGAASSLGHSGASRVREAMHFVGMNPDLSRIFR